MNLICFKHPQYNGNDAPVLSCKTCCSIFIGTIKAKNAEAKDGFNTQKWLEDKASAAEAKTKAKASNSKFGFNPQTV